ncbi:MAG TPA: outer membrane beta-barrel protein, partial [Pirellulaceae bacterium]|nr:outer membrane beta-barrel protein [Pirellulaceae bacterium]
PAPRPAEGYPPGSFGDPHFDPHVAGWQDYYVHRWFAEPWFSHSDPNDPYRHVGLGHPLTGTSWRNRPWFVGTFAGGVLMGDLIQDRVNASDTGFYGLRLGWDFDHYWGAEGRFAFAEPQLSDVNGLPLDRDAQNYFGDVSLVCYPWGDSCWRPYLSAGVGFQTLQLIDENGRYVSESPLAFPLGGGLKIFVSPWFTLRFDIVDNVAFGNDRVSLVNHFALMSGCELRFGGRPTSYMPWHGSTAYW